MMVDAKTFSLRNPGNKYNIDELEMTKMPEEERGEPRFDNNDVPICCDEVLGFSLANKNWCYFQVDLIRHVEVNVLAF